MSICHNQPFGRSASSLIEIQRFWAKDMDPGRDLLTVTKTHTAVSRSSRDDPNKLDAVVMMPILNQTEHCARCGAAFLLEENHATACTFHANQDGEPGEFKDVTVTDELTGVRSVLQAWTCCGRHHAFAPGCSARPHTCKEVMIQIRAEASPAARVENIDLSILKSVDISIFPNSTYDLQVHITKSLADVLHKYFSIDDIENYEITAQIPEPPPEPEESKHHGGTHWRHVRNVRRMLLNKKAKSAGAEAGDDDGSVFTHDDPPSPLPLRPPTVSTGKGNFFPPSDPAGSGRVGNPSPQVETPSTPTSTTSKSLSNTFSPWFRSATPKRVPQLESSTHSDSTKSTKSKSSSIFGGLFGSKKKKSTEGSVLSLTAEAEPTPPATTVIEGEDGQGKRLKFNMMRARANSHGDRLEGRGLTGSNHGTSDTKDTAGDAKATSTAVANRRQEAVYVKFLRLGGIQLEVSTAGFMLNLTKFKAQMDEFRCQGEVLQWKTLVFNMERHMAVSLFTNAASNSLSRFTQMFRFPGPVIETGTSTESGVSRTMSGLSDDTNMTTSMKRSALGLPPPKPGTSSSGKSEEDKAAALLGKKHAQGKGK
jgi:hypothetical protein